MKKDAAILIPTYEPDHNLVNVVNSLVDNDFYVIVVNDGSGEKYNSIFSEIKSKVVLLNHDKNKGKGAALKYGFSYLSIHPMNCNYVITCDGDGQHSIKDIIAVNELLKSTDQIVFGSRDIGRNAPKKSQIGNNLSKFTRTLLTKDFLHDDQCGLRGFPMRYLDELKSIPGERYEYEMNVVCSFQIKNYVIIEKPIETIYLNNNSNSHFSAARDSFRIQRTIFSNALIPIISYFINLSVFVLLGLIPFDLNIYLIAFLALFYSFHAYFGLLCLFNLLNVQMLELLKKGCLQQLKP